MIPAVPLPVFNSDALATALLANAFQSMAIAMFLALLLRLVPRLSASEQCRLWTAGIAAGAVLSFFPFELARHSGSAAQFAGAAGGTPFHIAPVWSRAIVLAWVPACVCASIRFTAGILAVRGLLRDARPAPEELAASFPQARLLLSHCISAPVTTGFLRPAILLPARLPQTLSRQQLEQVLLHELAHARRRDYQANLAVRLLRCLLPLSPALLYMDRRLAAARELACDDAVLACSPAPKAYAACLLHVAECAQVHKGHTPALGLLGRRSQLARRITHILAPSGRGKHARGSALLTWAAGGALAVLTAQLHAVPALVSFDSVETLPRLAVKQVAVPPAPVLSTEPAGLQPARLPRHRRVRVSTALRVAVAAPSSIPAIPSSIPSSMPSTLSLVPSVSSASSAYGWEPPQASAQLVVFWQQPVRSSPGTLVLLVSSRSRWLLYRTMPGFLLPI